MSIFHSSETGVVAQDIMSKIRPRHIWLSDMMLIEHLPENWDGTEEGDLAYQKASAQEAKEWLTTQDEKPVVAMRDMGLANMATLELGMPIVINAVIPEFHHGDIWIQVTRKGYFVVKRTA